MGDNSMQQIKLQVDLSYLHELHHHVGTAHIIIKSILGALQRPTPDLQRITRYSDDALNKLKTALTEIEFLSRRQS